jgi:hypothetical protein
MKEPWVRQEYIELTGNHVEVACGISDQYDWMRASFDGLSLNGELALEVKCPNFAHHSCALEGQVPTMYYPQVQHLLAVSGAKVLHYVSWSDNKAFGDHPDGSLSPPVKVRPAPDYIAWLIEQELAFVEELRQLREKE